MNRWLLLLANSVGHQQPTSRRKTPGLSLSTRRALSPRVEQGGRGERQLRNGMRHCGGGLSFRGVVGLVDPPYGLPATDPTQPRSAACFGCRGQPGGGPGRRQRLWRGSPSPLTGLGRLTPTTPSARREFPLDPLPSRGAADRRSSPSARPGPVGGPAWRPT
jgi:hypothetical protein